MPPEDKLSSGSTLSRSLRVGGKQVMVPILFILSRTVLAILVVSIAAALFPIQPWQPLWYLKAGQIAVDYGVTFLFALFLILLAGQLESQGSYSSWQLKSAKRLSSIAFGIYLLLVPIQLLSYGLHWLQSDQQTQRIIRDAQSQMSRLRSRIQAATSEAQLREAFGEQLILPLPNAPQHLAEKNKLMEAADARLFQLRGRLISERQQRLGTLAVNTAKGVIGSGVIAFGLAGIKRMQSS
jgi:hypothetical protein